MARETRKGTTIGTRSQIVSTEAYLPPNAPLTASDGAASRLLLEPGQLLPHRAKLAKGLVIPCYPPVYAEGEPELLGQDCRARFDSWIHPNRERLRYDLPLTVSVTV